MLNAWLERMPFFNEEENWKNFPVHNKTEGLHPFWSEYRYQYVNSLAEAEKNNRESFDEIFMNYPAPGIQYPVSSYDLSLSRFLPLRTLYHALSWLSHATTTFSITECLTGNR